MTVQEALSLYKIPYIVKDIQTAPDFESYQLTPTGSTATISRLKSRLDDLRTATGRDLDIIQSGNDLYIRTKTAQKVYKWTDYNGYIDFNDPRDPFIVGFNQSGIVTDTLDNARQMLVAGTTGSGKSVFLHNLITTFICNPSNYVYLVDCKKCEFGIYKDNANVCDSVFGENSAARYVNTIIEVMENRYCVMDHSGVNDFLDFKKLYPESRRYILIIDELADMISDKKAQKAIIPGLLRIAQKGRGAGCHVILATQRPDASIINGTLKGNLPTRISFRTVSAIDSRVILDQSGAEKLNGNGDGLYLRNGSFNLERVQAPFITLSDIDRLKTA